MSALTAASGRMRYPIRLSLAVLVMGLTALIAQVVLTRELLSLFLGNELSIALVLAVWLAAVAAGSGVGARVAARMRDPEQAFGWSQLVIALLVPAAVHLARSVRPPGVTPGEAFGPGAVLLLSLETLALVCFALGLQFVLAASAAARASGCGAGGAAPVAHVYALEALGAVLGGLAFHCYLSQHVTAVGAAAALGLLNTVSAAALLRPAGAAAIAPPPSASPPATPAFGRGLPPAICVLVGAPMLWLLWASPRLDLASVRSSPRSAGLRVVSHTPSRYGGLTSAVQEGQLSVFQSGVLVFTSEADYSDEVTAHLPLLEHPAPRDVLLIGGATGGAPSKALQHPIQQLDCVELDPKLFDEVRRTARVSGILLSLITDDRLHLKFGDARLLVRGARRQYDVVIVNVPDPTTAALNRFFTLEFFQEVARVLRPGGLMAVGLTGSEHLLSGPMLLAAATLDHTLRQVFADLVIVPGDRMVFLAAARPGVLTPDAAVLVGRLEARRIHAQFVNEAWLRDALLPFRAELVSQQVGRAADAPVNTDLNPVSYYHQSRVWLDQFSPRLARHLNAVSQLKLWWAAIPLPLALVALAGGRRSRRFRAWSVLAAATAVGGFGIVVEISGLLAFQAALGYLYHALGGLIAAFMAGLAAGAAVMGGRLPGRAAPGRLLVAGLLTALLISALLPRLLQATLPDPILAAFSIGVLLMLVGSLVGAIFPIAAAVYRGERSPATAGGAVYAADLIGSAGGAVFAGAFAVPLLGLGGTAHFVAVLLLTPLVLAIPLLRD